MYSLSRGAVVALVCKSLKMYMCHNLELLFLLSSLCSLSSPLLFPEDFSLKIVGFLVCICSKFAGTNQNVSSLLVHYQKWSNNCQIFFHNWFLPIKRPERVQVLGNRAFPGHGKNHGEKTT